MFGLLTLWHVLHLFLSPRPFFVPVAFSANMSSVFHSGILFSGQSTGKALSCALFLSGDLVARLKRVRDTGMTSKFSTRSSGSCWNCCCSGCLNSSFVPTCNWPARVDFALVHSWNPSGVTSLWMVAFLICSEFSLLKWKLTKCLTLDNKLKRSHRTQ